MRHNDAQQAAAQVSQTRKQLAKRKGLEGIAESVRKEVIDESRRGMGHDQPSKPSHDYDTLGSLFGAPRQMA